MNREKENIGLCSATAAAANDNANNNDGSLYNGGNNGDGSGKYGSKRVAGGLDLAEKGQIINSYTIHIIASMFRLRRFLRVIQEKAAHS